MKPSIWQNTSIQTRSRIQPWTLHQTSWEWHARPAGLATVAQSFDPISLEQTDAVELLNRTDTKFVMTGAQLMNALNAVKPHYWMLSISGQRLNHYRTMYFDSPDFLMYLMHVNGRANRYKVRSREYTDSHLSFLEVKHKTNKDRTIKERIPTAEPLVQMTVEAEDWLNGVFPYDSRVLEPKIWNTFTRMTLVSKQLCERVTLDVDLTFYNNNRVVHLDGIAIAEVKMDKGHCVSPFLTQMRAQRIHPRGFSKYCIGVAMLYDQVKRNALKAKLLWLDKMTQGVAVYE